MKRSLSRSIAAKGIGFARDVLPPSIQTRVPGRLRRLAARIFRAGKSETLALEDKLWGGFSQSALQDLERLASDKTAARTDRSVALDILARWNSARNDHELALERLRLTVEIMPERGRSRRHRMFEAMFLCELGRTQEARSILEARSSKWGFDSTRELLLANTWNAACADQNKPDATGRAL